MTNLTTRKLTDDQLQQLDAILGRGRCSAAFR